MRDLSLDGAWPVPGMTSNSCKSWIFQTCLSKLLPGWFYSPRTRRAQPAVLGGSAELLSVARAGGRDGDVPEEGWAGRAALRAQPKPLLGLCLAAFPTARVTRVALDSHPHKTKSLGELALDLLRHCPDHPPSVRGVRRGAGC